MENVSFSNNKRSLKAKENTTVKDEKPEANVNHQFHNFDALQEINKNCDDLIQMISLLQQQNADKNISDALVNLEQAKLSIGLLN